MTAHKFALGDKVKITFYSDDTNCDAYLFQGKVGTVEGYYGVTYIVNVGHGDYIYCYEQELTFQNVP